MLFSAFIVEIKSMNRHRYTRLYFAFIVSLLVTSSITARADSYSASVDVISPVYTVLMPMQGYTGIIEFEQYSGFESIGAELMLQQLRFHREQSDFSDPNYYIEGAWQEYDYRFSLFKRWHKLGPSNRWDVGYGSTVGLHHINQATGEYGNWDIKPGTQYGVSLFGEIGYQASTVNWVSYRASIRLGPAVLVRLRNSGLGFDELSIEEFGWLSSYQAFSIRLGIIW